MSFLAQIALARVADSKAAAGSQAQRRLIAKPVDRQVSQFHAIADEN